MCVFLVGSTTQQRQEHLPCARKESHLYCYQTITVKNTRTATVVVAAHHIAATVVVVVAAAVVASSPPVVIAATIISAAVVA